MDAKITLSFDEAVILKAKKFASNNNISLSRLVEIIFRKITIKNYTKIEDIPMSEWVNTVAEGPAEYKAHKKNRKRMRNEYYESKK